LERGKLKEKMSLMGGKKGKTEISMKSKMWPPTTTVRPEKRVNIHNCTALRSSKPGQATWNKGFKPTQGKSTSKSDRKEGELQIKYEGEAIGVYGEQKLQKTWP